MGNPMLELLNKNTSPTPQTAANNPAVSQAVQMYRAYQTAKNPMAMLQQMTAQNPMLAQLQRSGGNMQQTFYSMCQQRGVDPQTILSQFN